MNKEKWESFKTKAKEKFEDAVTNTYVFITDHPVLSSVIGTAAGAAVSGAIAYKVGHTNGKNDFVKECHKELMDMTKDKNIVMLDGEETISLAEGMNRVAEGTSRETAGIVEIGIRSLAGVIADDHGILIGSNTDAGQIEVISMVRDSNPKSE